LEKRSRQEKDEEPPENIPYIKIFRGVNSFKEFV
jgi:hypothetical protein